MAATIFLDLGDTYKGPSLDKQAPGQIVCHSFSHGISNPSSAARADGNSGTVGRCSLQDMSLSKDLDQTSADIMTLCCSGKTVPTATVSCYKSDDSGTDILYLKYTMTNVIFSNYSVSGSADGTPSESISLNYESIQWDYAGASGAGGADSGKNGTGSWDLSTNAIKA